MICRRCGADAGVERPGRRDACPRCDADLHACVQCRFYAPGQYNNCNEPQAERVLDPERSNYCDYFTPGTGRVGGEDPSKAAAKARLDALFGKKS
ncbi:MAG TPA: hypothetical protein VK997_05115 [Deferrisomatales bacterium]|nr:hypothetical protein [Deferrisomatales bacterium]